MPKYFPATIVEQTNDIGRKSYAIQYADGRIVHKGFRFYESAEKFIDMLKSKV